MNRPGVLRALGDGERAADHGEVAAHVGGGRQLEIAADHDDAVTHASFDTDRRGDRNDGLADLLVGPDDDALGHADNFIPANPLQTPPEIVPEWYLLPFYAILRAFDFNIGPIDSKLAGVLAMFASIGILFILPWLDTSRVRSMRYRPIARQFFVIFVIVCVALGWCGGQNPGKILLKAGQFSATLTYVEGGQVTTSPITSAGASQWSDASAAAEASAREGGATMTAVTRSGASVGTIRSVSGGTTQTRTVSAETVELLEEVIGEAKTEVGQAAPFFNVERHMPARFTVTNFAQVLTLYYFLFFLVILPILGLRERPGRVPDTIAKPVTGEAQGAS